MIRIKDEYILIVALALVIVTLSAIETSKVRAEETIAYVSNGDDGSISILKLDKETGELAMLDRVPAGPKVMHMALSPDQNYLYASIRSEPYSVISYSINPESGNLTQIGKTSLPDNMVFISVDKSGRFLLSVSNGGGKIVVNSIDINGTVKSKPIQTVLSGDNPHSIRIDLTNQFVYVPHLGNDRVNQYLFNNTSGMLTPNNPPEVYTKSGSGPRHFDFSPDDNFLFVSNEKDGTIYSFKIDKQTGVLEEIQRLPVLLSNNGMENSLETNKDTNSNTNKEGEGEGEGEEFANAGVADIHVAPNGKWVYVSERVKNTISLFSIDKTGNITYSGNYKTENTPRGFNIDPTGRYLLAAGQKSGYVSVYEIDQQNGALVFKDRVESGKDPNWIESINVGRK